MAKESDDYNEKCMKNQIYSKDKLPLNKMIEIPSIIVARAFFMK